jgi:hypothetical protein
MTVTLQECQALEMAVQMLPGPEEGCANDLFVACLRGLGVDNRRIGPDF